MIRPRWLAHIGDYDPADYYFPTLQDAPHVQDCDEHDNGNGHERLRVCFRWARSTPMDGKNQPCPVETILIKLPRDAAAELAESWWVGGTDAAAWASLLAEHGVASGVGITKVIR